MKRMLINATQPEERRLAIVEGQKTRKSKIPPIVIETSTLTMADKNLCAKTLKSVGISVLDCPISGTAVRMKDRAWTIFASGPKAAYKLALPVLQVFTDNVPYVGVFGNGTKLKFSANHLVAIYNVAYAESVALARKMGYPSVNVDQFPVSAEALRKLPHPVAERLRALPLMLRGTTLVVALEDPSGRSTLEEIEFASSCKVAPVLAQAGDVAAAVKTAYARIGIETAAAEEAAQGALRVLAFEPARKVALALCRRRTTESARREAHLALLAELLRGEPEILERVDDEVV